MLCMCRGHPGHLWSDVILSGYRRLLDVILLDTTREGQPIKAYRSHGIWDFAYTGVEVIKQVAEGRMRHNLQLGWSFNSIIRQFCRLCWIWFPLGFLWIEQFWNVVGMQPATEWIKFAPEPSRIFALLFYNVARAFAVMIWCQMHFGVFSRMRSQKTKHWGDRFGYIQIRRYQTKFLSPVIKHLPGLQSQDKRPLSGSIDCR